MKLTYNDQKIEVEIDHSKAACDAFFSSGYYVESGIDLTDDELTDLTENYTDELAEYCLEHDGYWKE